MAPRLQKIEHKTAAGERLDSDDALALFTTNDLFGLGKIANGRKEKIHGTKIHFGGSLNINHITLHFFQEILCELHVTSPTSSMSKYDGQWSNFLQYGINKGSCIC